MVTKKISLFILFGIICAELPIGFTEEEWNNRHLIREMGHRTDPPPAPVRAIVEYEPMQGVLIRYPLGISTSLVREMSEESHYLLFSFFWIPKFSNEFIYKCRGKYGQCPIYYWSNRFSLDT